MHRTPVILYQERDPVFYLGQFDASILLKDMNTSQIDIGSQAEGDAKEATDENIIVRVESVKEAVRELRGIVAERRERKRCTFPRGYPYHTSVS